MPSVSVIMNCYNSEKYLKEAIDSIYSQTFGDWEVIFWDNQSTDGSSAIAKSYDDRLKYYLGDQKITLGAARNKALEFATGDFIAFLDCDDLWHEEKLEKQLPLFIEEDVVLVYSDVIEFNSSRESRLYERRKCYVGECFPDLMKDYFLSLPSVMVRGSTLRNEPYFFDERYSSAEEAELFFRLALLGKFAMIDEPLAKYRIHEDSLTSTEPELIWKERYMIIDGFEKSMPEILVKYKREVKVWIDQAKRNQVMYCLDAGDFVSARRLMGGIPSSYKTLLLYILTFLPKSCWDMVKYLKGYMR